MSSDWQERFASTRSSASEAIALIPRGKRIFIGSGAAEPVGLVEELVAQHRRFADNTLMHLLTLGPAPYVDEAYRDAFRHSAFFIGSNVRKAVHEGRADYTPVFLSQIPELMRTRRTPVDVALIQVAPPDRYGFVNLGVSVDIVLAAVQNASLVIAEINPNMPRVFGSGFIPMDRIDAWVYRVSDLPEVPPEPLDDVALEIGRHVATLVEDGSTLQVGIGQIPDAALACLTDKRDLGVWSEMFSDGIVDLLQNGNITGRYKTLEPRVVSASFTFGSRRTYDYVDQNPAFSFRPSDEINDPVKIAQQHKMVAINTALQIDLTGQVCADSLGTKFYSGIGGQVDFIRGASMGAGGKPIIAVRSTAKSGTLSRIVANLAEGAGVVTSRGDVRYVVTEYGVADLLGRSVRERALALISIAHPDFRSSLLDAAKGRHYVFGDQIEPRASYPEAYEKKVTTLDGETVLLRPIREVDEERMRDLFYSFSETTKYRRWGTFVPQMHHRDLQMYLRVDDLHHVAIVVQTQPPGAEPELVGVGRYHTDPADEFAEVAVVIRDDWQGRGLGTALVQHLADIARENGLAGFTAQVLADNAPMLRVFHKLGLRTQGRMQAGIYELRMPFDNAPAPRHRDGDVPGGVVRRWARRRTGDATVMKLLVGLDLEGHDAGALGFAAWVAEHGADPVETRALHVIERDAREDAAPLQTIVHAAQERMRTALSEAGVAAGDVDVAVMPSVDTALCDAAAKADVLIMGRRAETGRWRVVNLGGVARRVLRRLPAPTVVVPPDLDRTTLPSGPVLLVTDLRGSSDGAAAFAQAFATAVDRPLLLAHVVPEPSPMTLSWVSPVDADAVNEHLQRSGARALQTWAQLHGLDNAEHRVTVGDVVDTVLELADHTDAALVVCGARQRSTAARIFSSSHGSMLALLAARPVAVVPPTWSP